MEINTSYYARILKNPLLRKSAVAISVNVPYYLGAIPAIPQLAPTWRIVKDIKSGKINIDQYVEQYRDLIINQRELSVSDIVQLLRPWANDGQVTMCCYEKVGDFCHRHVLADMINRSAVYSAREWVSVKDKDVDLWAKDTEFKPKLHSYLYDQPLIKL